MKKLLVQVCSTIVISAALAQEIHVVEDLKFRNRSLQSIYLEIPGVMNPNLSPLSTSNVDIPENTVIYFFHEKQKYPLLTIKKDMSKLVEVDRLIKERKKELGL